MAYSEAQITETLITLALCKYDYKLAAERTGIAPKTIQRWNEDRRPKTIPELLERAIAEILMRVPENWDGRDWAVAIGILMDKWLLLQGEATERTETLVREIETLTEAEKIELYNEARRILDETARSRHAGRDAGDEANNK